MFEGGFLGKNGSSAHNLTRKKMSEPLMAMIKMIELIFIKFEDTGNPIPSRVIDQL